MYRRLIHSTFCVIVATLLYTALRFILTRSSTSVRDDAVRWAFIQVCNTAHHFQAQMQRGLAGKIHAIRNQNALVLTPHANVDGNAVRRRPLGMVLLYADYADVRMCDDVAR